MKAAIRYYSKFGHTKQMVEAVKDIVGCEPQTVDSSILLPMGLPNPVRSRLSAIVTWRRLDFAMRWPRPCSARYAMPAPSAGNTLADAPCTSTATR